ncbi:hypothetical protein IV203_026766 [Nitzschia inconspicua]|uniref:Uncharacterized protein n=1 Tax=Nitzschia inconspicua TaxID=303405 RepID=A0A9K3LMW6_9STRA|nr:hypothetical protein IV203_026766 [Nitzschia inconspicua]
MKVLSFVAAALSAVSVVDAFAAIAPGAKIPSIELHKGFPPNFPLLRPDPVGTFQVTWNPQTHLKPLVSMKSSCTASTMEQS